MTDYTLGDTLDVKFTTRSFSTGAPTTLAGTPSVAAYPGNSTTELTAGITLSVDFDARTGLNNVRVVATGANGYATATTYFLVITAGTVGGVSVVGEVVGSWTIERSAAAVDLANGTDGLGAIKAETALIVADTNELQTDDVPGLIAALNDIAAGDVWAVDATTQQTQGTFGQAIGDPAADTTTIYQAVATDAAGDNVSVDVAAVKAETALIVADTNELQTDWVDAGRLDAILDTIAADVVNIDGAAMRGTDNAALASVVGALADAAADGDPTSADTVMQYVKQLINILVGTAGVVTFPAEAAPANAVSLAEVLRAIHADVTGLNGDAMRGTDSAALASVCTEARLSELDEATAGKMANQVDEIRTDTGEIGTAGAGLTGVGLATGAVDADALATDAVNEIARAILPQTNQALSNLEFLMVDSTDHVTPETGLTVTGQRSIDGGAFAAVSGTIAEVGNGIYQFDAAAADVNGTITTFRFSATGADDTFLTVRMAA